MEDKTSEDELMQYLFELLPPLDDLLDNMDRSKNLLDYLPPLNELCNGNDAQSQAADVDAPLYHGIDPMLPSVFDDQDLPCNDDDGVNNVAPLPHTSILTGTDEYVAFEGKADNAIEVKSLTPKNTISLTKEVHVMRDKSVKDAVLFNCPICSDTCNIGNISAHYNEKHVLRKIFVCKICEKSFKRRHDMFRHVEGKHGIKIVKVQ